MQFVVLGLGSNRAFSTVVQNKITHVQPVEILKHACFLLSSILENLRTSSVYKTKAMYVIDQSDFYNMAVSGCTTLKPTKLLDAIQSIEKQWGRDRHKEFENGPRTLDIDIELYGTQSIQTERLTIPHPRLSERSFVLVPLLELLSTNNKTKLQNTYVNADIPNRQKYVTYLAELTKQDIKKHCSPFSL